jgi:hypothetical protein
VVLLQSAEYARGSIIFLQIVDFDNNHLIQLEGSAPANLQSKDKPPPLVANRHVHAVVIAWSGFSELRDSDRTVLCPISMSQALLPHFPIPIKIGDKLSQSP